MLESVRGISTEPSEAGLSFSGGCCVIAGGWYRGYSGAIGNKFMMVKSFPLWGAKLFGKLASRRSLLKDRNGIVSHVEASSDVQGHNPPSPSPSPSSDRIDADALKPFGPRLETVFGVYCDFIHIVWV